MSTRANSPSLLDGYRGIPMDLDSPDEVEFLGTWIPNEEFKSNQSVQEYATETFDIGDEGTDTGEQARAEDSSEIEYQGSYTAEQARALRKINAIVKAQPSLEALVKLLTNGHRKFVTEQIIYDLTHFNE
jgi:hypothetical protein